jgi:manganese transport protein
VLFAVALLASGQSSTITGTLAGQVVMEGFLRLRIQPWLRRLISRSLAIVPAVLVIGLQGEGAVDELLVLSQVVLSLQLPFAVVPLITFTSQRGRMGAFANPPWVVALSGFVAALIVGLNGKLVFDFLTEWHRQSPGAWWLVGVVTPVVGGVVLLLVVIVAMPLLAAAPRWSCASRLRWPIAATRGQVGAGGAGSSPKQVRTRYDRRHRQIAPVHGTGCEGWGNTIVQ